MKKPVSTNSPGQLTVLAALLAGLALPMSAFADAPNHVVISQVYGGGGNSSTGAGTATYKNDFVELFNPTAAAVNVAGWTVQYGSASSIAAWSGSVTLTGSIGPGKYMLVKLGGGAAGVDLPAAEVTGGTNMSGTAGKVGLSRSATVLSGAIPVSPDLVDLVGFGTANGYEGAAATAPSGVTTNLTSMFRNGAGCVDSDNNLNDFTVANVSPRNGATAALSCGGAPPVAPIVPSCQAFSVTGGTGGAGLISATDADSIVTGASITSTAVAGITLGAFSPSSVLGQPGSANLNVDASVPVGVYATDLSFVNDTGQTASCSLNITVQGLAAVSRSIMEIQGSGATSAYNNQVHTTEGVVTFKFPGTGYFIQDAAGDNNPATSDGIYIFGSTTSANVGDLVRVTGTVTEYKPANQPFSYTEIKDVTAAVKMGAGAAILPVNVTMPTDLGAVQGMLVNFTNPLIINQVSSLGDRGEMTLASIRREVPTNRYPAGSAQAIQMAADNVIDQIVLDDGQFVAPNPVPYISPLDKTVRVGDTVTNLVGVVDFGSIGNSQNGYKLQPQSVPAISRTNPRTDGPTLPAGNVRVASANVLNFFTTFADGYSIITNTTGQKCAIGTPQTFSLSNCRGANNMAEFVRQRDKIVNELVAMNADVVGLMEIQNNGDDAVNYLVNSINAKVGFPVYAYVPQPPSVGDDAIRVAMIYKPQVVSLAGPAMSDGIDLNNRAPLAQTFKAANGAKFSVIVNHLKSKGSCPSASSSDTANKESGDGQGCWNATRVLQAQRLATYFIPQVQSVSGDPDVLVIGDMNSHGFEDPILVLTNPAVGKMVNELERFVRPSGMVYSYVFNSESGYLDHALASQSLDGQIAGATEWHNNADEPDAIDYNTESAITKELYVNNAYRASDHDPVVVSLNLTPTFVDVTASFATVRSGLNMNRISGQWTGNLVITNNSGAAINGPFQVSFNGLTNGVTMANFSGKRDGVPYITAGGATLAAGASITIPLVFNNPARGAISYTTTIFSGSF